MGKITTWILIAVVAVIVIGMAGCSMDADKALGEFDSITLPDGTRCVVYVVPFDRIRGFSCDFSVLEKDDE